MRGRERREPVVWPRLEPNRSRYALMRGRERGRSADRSGVLLLDFLFVGTQMQGYSVMLGERQRSHWLLVLLLCGPFDSNRLLQLTTQLGISLCHVLRFFFLGTVVIKLDKPIVVKHHSM